MSVEDHVKDGAAASRPAGKAGPLRSLVEMLAIVLVVIAAKTAIAEPFYIPSGSMEPTLLIGDELLATKFSYGYGTASLPGFLHLGDSARIFASMPKRGDVVVFRWPGDPSSTWVKRVIGLPGDRIALHNGQVWINGQPAKLQPDGMGKAEDESGMQVPAARFIETLPGGRKHLILKLLKNGPLDDVAEFVVPAGRLFVLGDNRDNSADSRVPVGEGGVGLLPMNNLVGRVDALVGSWDIAVSRKPIWDWPSGLRLSRFFSAVH